MLNLNGDLGTSKHYPIELKFCTARFYIKWHQLTGLGPELENFGEKWDGLLFGLGERLGCADRPASEPRDPPAGQAVADWERASEMESV